MPKIEPYRTFSEEGRRFARDLGLLFRITIAARPSSAELLSELIAVMLAQINDVAKHVGVDPRELFQAGIDTVNATTPEEVVH